MAPRLAEIVGRLGSAPGRKRLLRGAFFRSWPVFFPIAGAYRRTIIRRTRIVAVVGSFGKTTTTRAVSAALGLPRDPYRGWNAGAFLAAGLLRIRPGARHAALEVGISRKGTMARYARLLRPDIAVVTSIGSEHHESLGTLEGTREEKAAMVRALPPAGLVVLNGDDPNVLWMREATRARVITFGLGDACDVRASSVVLDIRTGMRFALHADGTTYEMTSRLIGPHMVHSILAAVAVAVGEGLPLEDALPRLRGVTAAPERLEVVPTEGGAFLLVDTYKSVLETIVTSFETLAALQVDRKIVVLGDIEEPKGSQGPLYKALGARLADIATRVVFVGGGKAFESLASGTRGAGMPKESVVYAGRSARRAAELVQEDLRAGDVVLIKGRSTQHLERVAFHLVGRPVPCDVEACGLKPGCDECPLIARAARRARAQERKGARRVPKTGR
jgi:UDP-N-acetylmuramoyl-tripeptide--D-alanyl-D-alanine ligase